MDIGRPSGRQACRTVPNYKTTGRSLIFLLCATPKKPQACLLSRPQYSTDTCNVLLIKNTSWICFHDGKYLTTRRKKGRVAWFMFWLCASGVSTGKYNWIEKNRYSINHARSGTGRKVSYGWREESVLSSSSGRRHVFQGHSQQSTQIRDIFFKTRNCNYTRRTS